jgi:LuxR family maltose regulon positive regulatory protein
LCESNRKSVARLTRRVENNILLEEPCGQKKANLKAAAAGPQEGAALKGIATDAHTAIVVGSPTWFQWLATAKSFAFAGESGTFTARKERAQRGSPYWRAYRMRHGVLHRIYLGKSEHLTRDRLNQAAYELAQAELAQPSHGPATSAAVSEHLTLATPVPQLRPLLPGTWCVPELPTTFVHRTQLIALFQHSNGMGSEAHENSTPAERPHIFVVAAPAGFGKTTTLRCWADAWIQSPCHVIAWVSLDADEAEPALFWRYVATAVEQACPGVGRAALAQLDRSSEVSPYSVVATLLEGITTTPFHMLLVLDDYHTITNPAIHESLEWLIARLPNHTCAALASRTRLPLALARLSLQGRVKIVTADELRFSTAEVKEFFARASAMSLSAEMLSVLDSQIAGWPAGLQLAASALRKVAETSHGDRAACLHTVLQSFVQGNTGELHAYLLEEIFSQQPPSLQDVLLRTGCLDQVCPSLCAAVVDTCRDNTRDTPTTNPGVQDELPQPGNSWAMLDQLARDQLLLTLLDEPDSPDTFLVPSLARLSPQHVRAVPTQRKVSVEPIGRENPATPHPWYRYHPLFAEFLRKQLQRTDPALFRAVQRRAAVWHARQGYVQSAVTHALASADVAYATQLIEQQAEATYQRGELVTLRQWLEALPSEIVRRRPLLSLLHANTLAVAGDFPAADRRLEEASRALAWPGDKEPSARHQQRTSQEEKGGDARVRILAARIQAAQAHIIYALRHRERALEVYRRALSLLPKDEQEHRLEMLSMFAEGLAGTRRLAESVATSEHIVALSRIRGHLPRLITALYDLGMYRRVQGSLPAAASCFHEALCLAEEREDAFPRPMSLVHFGIGRVLYEWNDLESARLHLLRALELNCMGGSTSLQIRCHSTLAFICEAQGNRSAALAHLQRMAEHRQMIWQPGLTWVGEAFCRFWLQHGQTDAALDWVLQTGVTPKTEATPEVDNTLVLLARLLLANGQAKESVEILQRVRTGLEQQQYIDDVIPIMMVQALAYQALGAAADAVTTLATALALAEPGGYLRTFVDEGPVLLPLLRAIGRLAAQRWHTDAGDTLWPSATYVRRVAAHCDTEGTSRVFAARMLPPRSETPHANSVFTSREWEVIEHLLTGHSTCEMMQALVVTRSTLKWHLGHIYAKLDARNRAEAVVRLHRLGAAPSTGQ